MKQNEGIGINLGLVSNQFCVSELIDPLRDMAAEDLRWTAKPFTKGAAILHQGEKTEQAFILENGLVKLTYQNANGDERIKSFIADRGIFGSISGNGRANPSRFSAICVEPSIIIRLPLAWVQQAIAANLQLQTAYLKFAGWLQHRKELREEALLCESAESRYCLFLEQEAELASRLPQGDIARFLGITPIAFSRIKRRMSMQGQGQGQDLPI
ncbi:hypothetical protein MNBD_ALPHA04-1370 [hydrothermal vent metagenome]|uniref:Cyclic nucleotide-binding domain-containing protein n=1 Tax=hydrothermal vent metagenome TaxID=652676 RepID=A0A3B0R819_9ZZZZ